MKRVTSSISHGYEEGGNIATPASKGVSDGYLDSPDWDI